MSLWPFVLAAAAVLLWAQPVLAAAPAGASAFRRVFLTTLLNPKAMLVGTILVPAMLPDRPLAASPPSRGRQHAYKGAAVVLGAFAIAAAASVLSS